ncbi:MAG: glycosyltransferase family 2 protein [bacterium]
MKASVVIPTYNRGKILIKTFPYWQKQTVKDFEIVIINDNSKDDTSSLIKQYISSNSGLRIRLIENLENMGSADGRNKGALFSDSEVIIYTDDDAFPSPDFIKIHLFYHKNYPNAIVRGPIINFSDLSFIDLFFKNPLRRSLILGIKGYSGNYFCTANVSIRRELIIKAGMFNLDFKRWQDAEFGYRLRKLGIKRFFDYGAWVLHYKTPLADPYFHYYNEGKYAAKLLKHYPNFSVMLRTGFLPFYPFWKFFNFFKFLKIFFTPYAKGFLEEISKKF